MVLGYSSEELGHKRIIMVLNLDKLKTSMTKTARIALVHDFIHRTHVHTLVYAREGVVINLDDYLIDFLKFIDGYCKVMPEKDVETEQKLRKQIRIHLEMLVEQDLLINLKEDDHASGRVDVAIDDLYNLFRARIP